MSRSRLDNETLKALYAAFDRPETAWKGWFESYVRALQWGHDVDDAKLRTPDGQRRLWTDVGISTAGPSESLDVSTLWKDPELAQAFVDLRKRGRDPAVSRRAQDLDEAHDRLLARVDALTEHGKTPRARLLRALHMLLPADFHCVLNDSNQMAVRDLVFGQRGLSRVQNHVQVRERLRHVLGEEADLAEHARRGMFCWWLSEHADELASGAVPAQAASPEPAPQSAAPTVETLEIWPLSRQYLWLDVYKSGITSLQLALRECLEPQTVETLTTALGEELELAVMSRRYLPTLLRDLQHLGLVSREGEEYRTTDNGEALLDAGGEDLLAEALCVRIQGFAMLLRKLAEGPLPGPQIALLLSPYTTTRSSGILAQRHLWWAQVAKVVVREGQTRELTAAGRALVERLPAVLAEPAPTGDVVAESIDEVVVVDVAGAPHPDLDTLWASFQQLATTKGILFGRDQVRALHTAWTFGERHDGTAKGIKRFALLSGLSGTGKTQLLLQYSRAVCRTMGLDEQAHLALVPVRPDWRDPSGMLGYFNALHAEPTFQAEPALRLVLRASRHPHLPFFLVLDEMNLARVERYFAPFLSAMETGGDLDLHAFDQPVNGVPATVRWPSNLRIGGTVNMDETTHAFSDKVLDRAFTLEFWDVELDAFFERRPRRAADDAEVEDALRAFQSVLRPIRRHVGYRTAGEVLDWVAAARESDPECAVHDLVDQALFSKVLPRLRGHDSKELEGALDALGKLSESRGLRRCAAKLQAMRERLRDTGVTGFWS